MNKSDEVNSRVVETLNTIFTDEFKFLLTKLNPKNKEVIELTNTIGDLINDNKFNVVVSALTLQLSMAVGTNDEFVKMFNHIKKVKEEILATQPYIG